MQRLGLLLYIYFMEVSQCQKITQINTFGELVSTLLIKSHLKLDHSGIDGILGMLVRNLSTRLGFFLTT